MFFDNEEFFECQTNGVISNSIIQNWTKSALDCYKINSRCDECPIARAHYSFKCQMKNIVDVLIKTQGIPDEKSITEETEDITLAS